MDAKPKELNATVEPAHVDGWTCLDFLASPSFERWHIERSYRRWVRLTASSKTLYCGGRDASLRGGRHYPPAGISSMDIHEHKPNLEGWRRLLEPLRTRVEGTERRTLKERWLIGAVLVGIWVITPAWIVLVGWLLFRLVLWLVGE
jgi:hypothetical protein